MLNNLQKDNRSDQQLITDYLKGDKKSIDFLVIRHLKPIYNFVYRYTGDLEEAQDITQETFVRMWKNLKKFDKEKSFKAWLFSIAKNTSIDFLRKKKTIPFSRFENEEGYNTIAEKLIDHSPSSQEIFEKKNIAESISKFIENLSPKYRKVFSLRYNDELTFQEIADFLGESINTVKSRYRRAQNILKKAISES